MFLLGLGSITVVHDRTDTSFSEREIASDYWCRPVIDRLLYYEVEKSQKNEERYRVNTLRHTCGIKKPKS